MVEGWDVTHTNPLHLTIRSTEAGNYNWTLHHGPDGAFTVKGTSKRLEYVVRAVLQAERDLAERLTTP